MAQRPSLKLVFIRFSRRLSFKGKGFKYKEKNMYFSLPSEDKCLEFMIF